MLFTYISVVVIKKIFSVSATREAAFVQSINAAGIMHVVTQQCSSGQETFCTCDNSRNGQPGKFRLQYDV